MTPATEPRVLVLHALRLKGFADAEAVAVGSGLDSEEVAQRLKELGGEDLVAFRDGRLSGWTLTPAGRKAHADLLSAELDRSGRRGEVEAAYRDFLGLNKDLLEVCTMWQLRPSGDRQVPNDHSDAAYDDGVVARLAQIDAAVQPVCIRLGDALDRFAGYGPRLSRARTRVEAGEAEWFTRPVIDSYHTVWFELHEDLLVTLGIERSREGAQSSPL